MLICDYVIWVFSSELHLGLLRFHCNNVIILPVAENGKGFISIKVFSFEFFHLVTYALQRAAGQKSILFNSENSNEETSQQNCHIKQNKVRTTQMFVFFRSL
ncbi:hypothetical protein PRUPE_6G130800 [Prunus persica]|uniref:Uncharacterized protein n=1 Tax=Prunus persica TaxID=3760 RepID=A0A251NPT8_PRUPE|nr:hypothetical protein PRUPE_6G130800 [Prunus persica]